MTVRMRYAFAMTFELNQSERNNAADKGAGTTSGRTAKRIAFCGELSADDGATPLHLVEPTDIFTRSIRESVIVGYTL